MGVERPPHPAITHVWRTLPHQRGVMVNPFRDLRHGAHAVIGSAWELVRGAPAFSLTTFAAQPTRHLVVATTAPPVIGMGAALLSAPVAPLATTFDEFTHQPISWHIRAYMRV